MYRNELIGKLLPYFISYFIFEDLPWIQEKQSLPLNHPVIRDLLDDFVDLTTQK